MDKRPNKRALIEGLDVYRDAMRPFMVRCLKRVHGGNVEDHIRKALRDEQRSQFEQNLSESQSIEEAIDINHFPQLVKAYWHEAFRDAFRSGSYTRDTLFTIGEARNKASHPGLQDAGLEYTVDRLDDISGVLIDINEPELSQSVETIRAELMPFRMFAHRFHQGGRDVYAFPLNLATLDKLLPDRIDDRVVKDANRPLTPSHAKKIQQYLEEREDWLLGTLLLGVSPEVVDFRPYTDSGANTSVGELTITIDGAASMKMFDGQHRRRAIRDVLYELSHGTRYSEKLSFLREASLPIMLYVEDDIEALRQMFADAAKTRSIERNTVTRFDQTDTFNLAALWIARESDLFAGRVEMERASVARSSPHIIAVNQLAMTLKTLEVGYKGRVSKNRNDEYMLDLDALYERCLTWSDDFMPAARHEYNSLITGETDNSDIPQERARTMAYNATVIRLIAGCYYEWTKDGSDWKPLAEFLRDASFHPGSYGGALLVDAGAVAPGGISPSGQLSQLTEAVDYVVRLAKEE